MERKNFRSFNSPEFGLRIKPYESVKDFVDESILHLWLAIEAFHGSDKLFAEYFSEQDLVNAMHYNSAILCHIPKSLRTKKVCERAHESGSLPHVPEKHRSYDLCMKAVSGRLGFHLRYVPEKNKTRELCRVAINNGAYMKHVPEHLLRDEDFLLSLSVLPRDLADEYQTHKLCSEAVKRSASALKYVSERYKTEELCRMALLKNGDMIDYVPGRFRKLFYEELGVRSEWYYVE